MLLFFQFYKRLTVNFSGEAILNKSDTRVF